MSETFTVACIQNSAIDDIEANLLDTTELVHEAVAQRANFVCLPEYFSCLEKHDQDYIDKGFTEDDHPALEHFILLAKELNIWVLLGSLAVKVSDDKVNNRSYVIRPDGEIAATYNKIHLFDVALKKGEQYKESRTVDPGAQASVVDLPWGRLGLSVCYDVRFPQLYRALGNAGADFISIPAAFTATTGAAHWHVLVRARAIETGCFVFAPNQFGKRPWGRRTYGHSLIVSPWGEILSDAGEERGFAIAEIDPAAAAEARRMIPALSHDREIVAPSAQSA